MAPDSTPPAPDPWQAMGAWSTWFCAAAIAATALAAYANSLTAPFIFDDLPSITENPTIRSLWPVTQPLSPPGGGHAVAGRPVVNLSLALNYALGGTNVTGYHIGNLLIHIAAGLALFGIVRRTFGLPWAPESLRRAAQPLGFSVALLWTVHPLQTESVTFVIQRTESLAGLVYLLVLYGFIRGGEPGAGATGSPSTGSGHSPPQKLARHERGPKAGVEWLGLSVAACFIGVATKEILATAPLVLLLYDRTFLAGSFREAGRKRRWFYLLLVLSWIPLALLMWSTQGRGGTVLIGQGVNAWMSLITQARAVTGYLGLVFWPHPLVVDYGDYITEIVPRVSAVWPQFLLVTALFGATLVALVRRPWLGFLGAWFFIILAPSSSFIPLLSQVRAEHRMYLPLAAVLVLVVLGLHRAAGRAAPVVVVVLAAVLGVVTAARNHDYRSGLELWTATVRDRPGNPRAHYSLGLEYYYAGDTVRARREYEEALRLEPSYLDPHMSLAGILLNDNRPAEARLHIEAAVQLGPTSSNGHNSLGHLLLISGDAARAQPYFETAVRLDPNNHEAHNNLGCVLASAGRTTEAIEHFRRAVALQPSAGSLLNLGDALVTAGQAVEAVVCLEEAVRLEPEDAGARVGLGEALAAAGRHAEAAESYRRALQLEPGHARASAGLRALDRASAGTPPRE